MASLMSISFANAQKLKSTDVPETVKASLQNKYPEAKELKWEKENGNYEAAFKEGKTEYSLLIDASGNIIETEVDISFGELPAAAKDYISKNYPGQKIKETAKIIDAKGIVTYEAEVKGEDLIFDNTGKYLKKETGSNNEHD